MYIMPNIPVLPRGPSHSVPVIPPPKDTPILEIPPTHKTGRTPNDQRSAEQIVDNPLFVALEQYPDHLIKGFYTHIGGNWDDKSLTPEERAAIAADAERVLEYIDRRGGEHSKANNHTVDGMKIAVPLIAPRVGSRKIFRSMAAAGLCQRRL